MKNKLLSAILCLNFAAMVLPAEKEEGINYAEECKALIAGLPVSGKRKQAAPIIRSDVQRFHKLQRQVLGVNTSDYATIYNNLKKYTFEQTPEGKKAKKINDLRRKVARLKRENETVWKPKISEAKKALKKLEESS
jgi:hypothetical protein